MGPLSHILPEQEAYAQGYRTVAGIDEAGRGPLAGPVVAAAVVLPAHGSIHGVGDSKKISPLKRDALFSDIHDQARAVGIGIVDQREIEEINILQASLKAMKLAVKDMNLRADYLLVDGNHPIPMGIPQKTIKGGDSISPSIGAASIIAKVTRDRIMLKYNEVYPDYGFDRHKGYGTKDHMNAIKRFGCCEIHRRTFRGVREYLK